jgi:hypothetical protein
VDKVYWNNVTPTNGLGIYVKFRPDFNPATASGYIAHVGETTNASPVARIGVASGQYYFRYHNGGAVNQVNAAVSGAQGQVVELLATFDETNMTITVYVDGVFAAHTSTGVPAGLFAPAWSGDKIVLNGYDTFPLANEFLLVKVISESAFTRSGSSRLPEIRDAVLDPFGVLIE